MSARVPAGRAPALMAALILVVLGGCDRTVTEPGLPTLTGSWTLASPGADPEFTGELELVESPTGRLTGSGRMRFPHEPEYAVTLRWGTHTYPDVRLELSTSQIAYIPFQGRTSEDGMEIEGAVGMIRVTWVRSR